MTSGALESDWKIFREIREVALERFCGQVLADLAPVCSDESRTLHERYLEAHRLLKDRDRKLAQAFDGPRRSQMHWQLSAMHALGLLEPDELTRFSPTTRERVLALAEAQSV